MVDQFAIVVFGLGAVFMSQSGADSLRRWACVCGLLSEPAWFYTAYAHQQWGVVVLACFYTIAWGKGFYTFWIEPRRAA